MRDDPNAMKDATRNAPDSALRIDPTAEQFSFAEDAWSAIGYEAADPSLHAPFWNEALLGNPPKRNLR